MNKTPPKKTPAKLRFLAAMNTGQRVHRPRRGVGSYDRNQQSLKRVLDNDHDPPQAPRHPPASTIAPPTSTILPPTSTINRVKPANC
jgi:hypothetical protein